MTDGDTSPDDASDTAGSGRAHGTAEPRAPFPTVMERVWAHNREKLRQWSLAHPAPSPGPPEPDPAAEPDPPVRARASAGAQADHPDRPGVLRWLPASLQRLYRRLAEAVPTPATPAPARSRRTTSGQAPARRGSTGSKSPTTPSAGTGRRRRSCSAPTRGAATSPRGATRRTAGPTAASPAATTASGPAPTTSPPATKPTGRPRSRSTSSPGAVRCACSPSGGSTAKAAGSSGPATAN